MIWCAWVIILGASCQSVYSAMPVPSATPASSATPNLLLNWWTSWLIHPVCKPPCWHNITPGVTTKDDALRIIEAAPELTITYKTKDAIEWEFNQNKEEEIGWLHISQSEKVDWLINTSGESLLLKKVIAAYGNPRLVNPFDCREGKCDTALVYPDLGMLLTVYIGNTRDNSQPQFEILPDTDIYRVHFMEPGTENSLSAPMDKEILMDWKGYGIYSWPE